MVVKLGLSTRNTFHFADNTDSYGCCCFWKSAPSAPKEYYVDKAGTLKRFRKSPENMANRIKSNRRLARMIERKFDEDTIDTRKAFERLKKRITHNFYNGEKITAKKINDIVKTINEIKKEIDGQDDEVEESEDKVVRHKKTRRVGRRRNRKVDKGIKKK